MMIAAAEMITVTMMCTLGADALLLSVLQPYGDGEIEPNARLAILFRYIITLYCVHMSVFPRSHHIYSVTEKNYCPTRPFIISGAEH